jgi:hypothetical protein
VRSYELKRAACQVLEDLTPDARAAVVDVIAEMMDDRVPLVGPKDFAVRHGPNIMGRAVPGTDLGVCYVPAGDHGFVVDIIRQ